VQASRYARSALGPCHNSQARAWAVTNGRPRFGGTAGHGPFGSRSWDNADGRFGLWSRRSGFESYPRLPFRPGPRNPRRRASFTQRCTVVTGIAWSSAISAAGLFDAATKRPYWFATSR
jgi:hypothetical protein